MKRTGAVLVDPRALPCRKYDEEEREVLGMQFKADLNQYLGALVRLRAVHSLDEYSVHRITSTKRCLTSTKENNERAEKKGPRPKRVSRRSGKWSALARRRH